MRQRPGRRRGERSSDDGAAAIEFALVSVFLFPLIFGLLDYGLWFADALATRDGARAAARAGSLGSFGDSCDHTYLPDSGTGRPVSPPLRNLACQAVEQVSPLSGEVFVRIRLVTDSTTADSNGSGETTWEGPPEALRVCLAVKHQPTVPGVPLPNGGLETAKVQMPLEQVPLEQLLSDGDDALATGGGFDRAAPTDWQWC